MVQLVELRMRAIHFDLIEGTPAGLRHVHADMLGRALAGRPRGLVVPQLEELRRRTTHADDPWREAPIEVHASVRVPSGSDGRGRIDLEVVFYVHPARDPIEALERFLANVRMHDVGDAVELDD
jgi:hypothetical protein